MAGVMAEELRAKESSLDATLDGQSDPGVGQGAAHESAVSANPQVFENDNTMAGGDVSLNTARRFSGSFPVEQWDRYELLGVIGRGGMGTVYKGRFF